MMASIFLALLVLHVVGAQNTSLTLLERFPCRTWKPLGNNSQPLDTLPYTAVCMLSEDGTQLIMQVAAMTQDTPFTGLIATAIQRNKKAWTNAGSFDITPFGFTLLNCPDGSQSIVKSDFSEEFVFSQAWNIPTGVEVEEIGCRFLIAETEEIYWNDVILFAVSAVDSSLVVNGGSAMQSSASTAGADPTPGPFEGNLVIGGQATSSASIPNPAENMTKPDSMNATTSQELANHTLSDILHGSNDSTSTLMENTTEATIDTTTGTLLNITTVSPETSTDLTTHGNASEAAGTVSADFANFTSNFNVTNTGGANTTNMNEGENLVTTTGSIMDMTTREVIALASNDSDSNATSLTGNHQNVTNTPSNFTSKSTNASEKDWNVTDASMVTTTATLDVSNTPSVTANTSISTSTQVDTSNSSEAATAAFDTSNSSADTSNTTGIAADTSNTTGVIADTSSTSGVTADPTNSTTVTAGISNSPQATAAVFDTLSDSVGASNTSSGAADSSNPAAATFDTVNTTNSAADTSVTSPAVTDSTAGVSFSTSESANPMNTPSLSGSSNVNFIETSTVSTEAAATATKTSTDFPFVAADSQNFNASSASNPQNATDLTTSHAASEKQGTDLTTQSFELTAKTELSISSTAARIQRRTTTRRPFARGETTTFKAPPVLTSQSVKKNVQGQPTGYWCQARGTIYVLVPGSNCRSYFVGNYQQSMTEVNPMARFVCSHGTAFDTNLCTCAWPDTFTCPPELSG